MFFSTHYQTNNGVDSDGKTWNDNQWHWVEFESSMDTPRYAMTFEDGSNYEETNVNAGFMRDGVPFRVFCAQSCNQPSGVMKVSEIIIYRKILTAAEKAANRAYLSTLLSALAS